MADYNSMELMICVAARFMENGCSAEVLRILREEVDPHRYIIGR